MKTTRLIALLAVLALVIAACTTTADPSDELGLVTAGTLTVCTDSPYPPMEFEQDGEFTGFDIELMRAIATELELDGVTVINSGWDPIVSGLALEAGDCDIAAASITITAEREESIDFTDGYFTADQSLLVSDASGLGSLTDFSGKNLGVQTETTGAFYANDNAPEGTTIIAYDNPGDLMTALAAGNVDGVLQDIVPNADYALNNAGVTLAETYPTAETYGFAIKEEGAEDLLAAVNAALKTLRDDGTYQSVWNDWFG